MGDTHLMRNASGKELTGKNWRKVRPDSELYHTVQDVEVEKHMQTLPDADKKSSVPLHMGNFGEKRNLA